MVTIHFNLSGPAKLTGGRCGHVELKYARRFLSLRFAINDVNAIYKVSCEFFMCPVTNKRENLRVGLDYGDRRRILESNPLIFCDS